jgi:hypothetical protein
MKRLVLFALLLSSACSRAPTNANEATATSDIEANADAALAAADLAIANADAALNSANERNSGAEKPTVKPPKDVVASNSLPSFDTASYCKQVGEAGGGSYIIEKGCREQEAEAVQKLEVRSIPARVMRYCTQVGRAGGGSYMILNGCVDQELEAARDM